ISGIAAMRVQVRVLGRFHGIGCFSRARMQVIIKTSRQRRSDSRHLGEVRYPGTHHPLQAAEVLQKRAPLRGPEARHDFQNRLVITARALAAMAADREAMRFVADSLNEAGRPGMAPRRPPRPPPRPAPPPPPRPAG